MVPTYNTYIREREKKGDIERERGIKGGRRERESRQTVDNKLFAIKRHL